MSPLSQHIEVNIMDDYDIDYNINVLGAVNCINWLSNRRQRRLMHGYISKEYHTARPYC